MTSYRSMTALLMCASLLVATPAAAQWSETFKSDAIGSYEEEEGQQYLVVAAGERKQSAPAAESLTAALRAAKAKMVMDDKSLGDVSLLDDAAIVAKAAKLPIQQIVIVRIFETAEGAPNMAVVTTYDKEANVLWALSATEGEPLAAAVASGPVKPGKASVAIGKLHESSSKDTAEARKKYDANYIWGLQHAPTTDDALNSQNFTPLRGMFAEKLSVKQFYEALDRPDYAAQHSKNYTMSYVSYGMFYAGLVGIVGFGYWTYNNWSSNNRAEETYNDSMIKYEELLAKDPTSNRVPPVKGETKSVALPLSLTAASLAVLIVGELIYPKTIHPINIYEANDLINDHNQNLKEELGLPEDYSPPSRSANKSESSRLNYNFDLATSADSAEFRLRLDF